MATSTDTRTFFGHPRGLSTLFFTEMWERFSYYGLRPLLVLFMSAALMEGGFNIPRGEASAIVGIYTASVYLSSLPGGWVADRLLGLRRAIMLGALLISLGHVAIGIASFVQLKTPFFLGLVLIVMGTGLLKPNISAIVGDLYPEGGARRDAGFSVFYMGINMGSFFGQLATGFLGEMVGWHWGFGAAGVGMFLGLVTFAWRSRKTLGNLGMDRTRNPDPVMDAIEQRNLWSMFVIGLLLLGLMIVFVSYGVIDLHPQEMGEYLSYVLVGVAVLYFTYLYTFGRLSSDEKKRVAIIGILFIGASIFWSAFEQAPTSLNLFARDFTDRSFFGWTIPVIWFQSINSLFVVVGAPLFAVLWIKLAHRGYEFSGIAKFAFALFFTSIGFAFMIVAAQNVLASGGTLKVSAWWLTISYIFQTFGELCLSPVGLSSMTKLAPRRFVGQMMGIWFLADALGSLIAGLVGGKVDPEKLEQMPTLFIVTSASLFVGAVVLWLLIPITKLYLTPAAEKGHLE